HIAARLSWIRFVARPAAQAARVRQQPHRPAAAFRPDRIRDRAHPLPRAPHPVQIQQHRRVALLDTRGVRRAGTCAYRPPTGCVMLPVAHGLPQPALAADNPSPASSDARSRGSWTSRVACGGDDECAGEFEGTHLGSSPAARCLEAQRYPLAFDLISHAVLRHPACLLLASPITGRASAARLTEMKRRAPARSCPLGRPTTFPTESDRTSRAPYRTSRAPYQATQEAQRSHSGRGGAACA